MLQQDSSQALLCNVQADTLALQSMQKHECRAKEYCETSNGTQQCTTPVLLMLIVTHRRLPAKGIAVHSLCTLMLYSPIPQYGPGLRS